MVDRQDRASFGGERIAVQHLETDLLNADEKTGRLPDFIVIGAMRCGTTALHRYLDAHPEISMSHPKELNFFTGRAGATASWQQGNWSLGVDWYRSRFAGAKNVAGESSPGYTSPDHSYAAQRIAGLLPDALLVYLVRDPIERAVSQYRLHRRDGTEPRQLAEALLDPHSQYISRSRYFERLQPFLRYVPKESIHIVQHEELRAEPGRIVRSLCSALDIDPDAWPEPLDPPPAAPVHHRAMSGELKSNFAEQLAEDAQRFEVFSGLDLSGWRL